jgi:hypothetical protein
LAAWKRKREGESQWGRARRELSREERSYLLSDLGEGLDTDDLVSSLPSSLTELHDILK